MNKIGILFGMENTFPPALVEKINSMKVEGVEAEFVKVGGVMNSPLPNLISKDLLICIVL